MLRPIKERIADLLREIAEISEKIASTREAARSHPAQGIMNADLKD